MIVAGPLFGRSPAAGSTSRPRTPRHPTLERVDGPGATRADVAAPSFGVTIATVLLPVVLMLGKALVDIIVDDPEAASRRSSTSSATRSSRC